MSPLNLVRPVALLGVTGPDRLADVDLVEIGGNIGSGRSGRSGSARRSGRSGSARRSGRRRLCLELCVVGDLVDEGLDALTALEVELTLASPRTTVEKCLGNVPPRERLDDIRTVGVPNLPPVLLGVENPGVRRQKGVEVCNVRNDVLDTVVITTGSLEVETRHTTVKVVNVDRVGGTNKVTKQSLLRGGYRCENHTHDRADVVKLDQ